jgi:gliding motility-associated-like protein
MLVTNEYGCFAQKDTTINTFFDHRLNVPNALTPNEGIGDQTIFLPKGKGIEKYRLQIFNAFGELLWETDKLKEDGQPAEGWYGDFKGNPLPQDVYVWKITATFKDGTIWDDKRYGLGEIKRGTVSLIR